MLDIGREGEGAVCVVRWDMAEEAASAADAFFQTVCDLYYMRAWLRGTEGKGMERALGGAL